MLDECENHGCVVCGQTLTLESSGSIRIIPFRKAFPSQPRRPTSSGLHLKHLAKGSFHRIQELEGGAWTRCQAIVRLDVDVGHVHVYYIYI